MSANRRIPSAVAVVAVVGILAAATAAVAAAFGFGGADPKEPPAAGLPPAMAMVTRQTLTQTERVAGSLGYGPVATLLARPGSIAPETTNTLTWLPPAGAVIMPGEPVFKVDDRPVVLIAGGIPLYRVLAEGARGTDVRMLETNLSAWGYRGFSVDTAFTSSTAAALRRWQHDAGLTQTGTLDVNRAVVAPGAIRVAAHKAAVGAGATGPVLDYTDTTRIVTVPLAVARRHLVHIGLSATVTLPDGKAVTGTVAGIGTVAVAGSDGQGDGRGDGQGAATVEVTVTIADQATLGVLDAAPVRLTLVTEERYNVLTVPVGALLALAEGGYGVQIVTGSTTRYVPVQTGMFADGRVEVSGDGITEGLTVGVPA